MAVDSNAPAVTLGFGTLAVPSKPLLWAVHAGLAAVPEKAVAQREWCWGGRPWDPTPVHGSGWPKTSQAQAGPGFAPSQLRG